MITAERRKMQKSITIQYEKESGYDNNDKNTILLINFFIHPL